MFDLWSKKAMDSQIIFPLGTNGKGIVPVFRLGPDIGEDQSGSGLFNLFGHLFNELPPKCPPRKLSMSFGIIVLTTNFFFKSPLIRIELSGVAVNADKAVSIFPRVADKPHVFNRGFHFRSLARHSSV